MTSVSGMLNRLTVHPHHLCSSLSRYLSRFPNPILPISERCPRSWSRAWAAHILVAAVASRESCLVCKKRLQKPRNLKPKARAVLTLDAQQLRPHPHPHPPPTHCAHPSPGREKRWGRGRLKAQGSCFTEAGSSGWWPWGRSRGGAVETLRGAQAPAPAWGVERDGGAQPGQRCGATAAWSAPALRTIGVVAERVAIDRHSVPRQRFPRSAARLIPCVERSSGPGASRLLGAAGP